MALKTLAYCARLLVVLSLCGSAAYAAPTDANAQRQLNEQFVAALGALNAGDPAAAIPVFRHLLARDTSLVRVRLELGRAYFFNRQWSEARREFVRVLSTDIPPEVRRNVLVFIRRIDARRGFDWNLDIGVARLGNEATFDTDEIKLRFGDLVLPSTVARSSEQAFGIVYRASARFAVPVQALSGPRAAATFVFSPFAFGEFAEPVSLRDSSVGARAGLQIAGRQTTGRLDFVAQRRDLSQRYYEVRHGVELRLDHRRNTGLTLFGSMALFEVNNRVNDFLDGSQVNASVGIQRGFGGRLTMGGTAFGEWRNTEREFDTYLRYGASIFGDAELGFGLNLRGSLFFARRDYSTPNVLFVNNPDEREVGGTLRVAKTDLFLASRFTPYIELSGRRVESGIDAFSFRETGLTVGVEKAF